MLALIGGEEVHDYVAIVHDEPAFLRLPLHAALFLMILFCGFQYAFGERRQHAVAGAVADDEIVSKRCDIFDVQ